MEVWFDLALSSLGRGLSSLKQCFRKRRRRRIGVIDTIVFVSSKRRCLPEGSGNRKVVDTWDATCSIPTLSFVLIFFLKKSLFQLVSFSFQLTVGLCELFATFRFSTFLQVLKTDWPMMWHWSTIGMFAYNQFTMTWNWIFLRPSLFRMGKSIPMTVSSICTCAIRNKKAKFTASAYGRPQTERYSKGKARLHIDRYR